MSPKVAAADAVQAMLERGARPAEPFPGTQKPWRCVCLVCGEESRPRYNDVVNKGSGACNGTCRSRKIAAKHMRSATEAAAVMRSHGWEPLDPYPGAGKAWRSRCANCGVIKAKKLSHVQRGAGVGTNCAGRDVTEESARAVMLAAGMEPLARYPGTLRPWLSRCLACGHLGSPCYAKVRARGRQCWSCRSDAIADALRLDDHEATASMLQHNNWNHWSSAQAA